ncbi:hypothetical protein ACHAWF_005001 [Thalassiosira exigua]
MCNYGSCFGVLGLSDQEVIDHAEALNMVSYGVDVGCAGDPVYPSLSRNETDSGLRYKWEWISVERNGVMVKKPLGSIRVSLGSMSRVVDVDALANFILANYKDVEADPQPDDFDAPTLTTTDSESGSDDGNDNGSHSGMAISMPFLPLLLVDIVVHAFHFLF